MTGLTQQQSEALQRVHESFALQGAMQTMGAQITHLAPGEEIGRAHV